MLNNSSDLFRTLVRSNKNNCLFFLYCVILWPVRVHICQVNKITLIMSEINGDVTNLSMEEDTDNLPHNLARYARASYSKKVCKKYALI